MIRAQTMILIQRYANNEKIVGNKNGVSTYARKSSHV